jgi:hypothetical protein
MTADVSATSFSAWLSRMKTGGRDSQHVLLPPYAQSYNPIEPRRLADKADLRKTKAGTFNVLKQRKTQHGRRAELNTS